MTKKKKPQNKSTSIQIPKREPGKVVKTDYLKNLRPFPNLHPVDDLLGLFPEQADQQDLDAQNDAGNDAQTANSLDAQVNPEPTPKIENLGLPNDKLDGAQIQNTRTPGIIKLGRHEQDNLDALTPKTRIRASKKVKNLDALVPAEKNLDAQTGDQSNIWNKYEKNRSTARLSLRPDASILRKFKVFCAEKELGLTEFFEISGLRFIEMDVQMKEDLDVLTPLDDRRLKILYKTKPTIINLYLRYNTIFNEISGSTKGKWTARWTPRDDAAAQRYNEIPPSIVELGIIQTQMNKGIGEGKIQTFKYYTEEIEKVLASGVSDEMLETILQYHRQIWKGATGREIDLKFLDEAE